MRLTERTTTIGPRERATLGYLIRHGIEYSTRRGPRVPRIPDVPRGSIERPDWRMIEAHRGTYPDAYRTDDSSVEGARVRELSAIASASGVLPTYAVDRETISERVRRYDIDDRVSRDLERVADAILRADGYNVDAVDVVDRWTLFPEVTPDTAAYRGAAHYRAPAIHRSARKVGRKSVFVHGPYGTRILLAATRIKRADGTTVLYLGCVGPTYAGRKIIVQPRVKGTGRGRTASTIWSLAPQSVKQRWATLLKGGSTRNPITPDVIAALKQAEQAATADLVNVGRVTIGGATLDAAPDRSVNGRARVIVRGTDDARPVMTDDASVAIRRALIATLS